uniref:Uncharacterized protein n=1 Tax=Meloidogyne enterolobii TaxID=390850 RepID=A0A6V7XD31_MELEN|nr:unnamed protein product [Meloidogyne enterolobii]
MKRMQRKAFQVSNKKILQQLWKWKKQLGMMEYTTSVQRVNKIPSLPFSARSSMGTFLFCHTPPIYSQDICSIFP